MKILSCPLNGPRNIQEFVYGGEVRDMPDPLSADEEAWPDYTFLENNSRGVIREWWCHRATNYWFIAERDTATDEILRTYPANEVFTATKIFQEDDT